MERALIEAAIESIKQGRAAALALVVGTRGSSPRKAGASMIVGERTTLGTVGGGPIEARALETARTSLSTGASASLRLDLTGAQAEGEIPICGGIVDLFICRIDHPGTLAAWLALLAALDAGKPSVLVLDSTAKRESLLAIVGPDGRGLWTASADPIALDREQLEQARTGILTRDGKGLMYVPNLPRERLLILGGGHVGSALAQTASRIGFAVTVADPRPEYSDEAGFGPDIEARRLGFPEAVAAFAPGPRDYAVVVSPGHHGDLEAARALLGFRPAYVGIIGSRRKTRIILDRLRADGFDAERVERLCAPIGLDIGAETPEEIALAIAAELVAYRREGPCLSYLQQERIERRNRPYS